MAFTKISCICHPSNGFKALRNKKLSVIRTVFAKVLYLVNVTFPQFLLVKDMSLQRLLLVIRFQ